MFYTPTCEGFRDVCCVLNIRNAQTKVTDKPDVLNTSCDLAAEDGDTVGQEEMSAAAIAHFICGLKGYCQPNDKEICTGE
ncbi:hypothetical protein Q8A67_021696 [Cirrhinus molitorella]|uniref:Uncharacterized protein n=1 Tax=Cirrhinus molitorella TaxID=172907 RepID=A0AA88TN06_9TELE|nr:hypothetical protein Q8A67_021696 [Cirrhinus molitorella]